MNTFQLDRTKYNLLYSSYSWSNSLVALFSGFIINNVIGLRKGLVLGCTVSVLGQCIVTCGGILRMFWLMIVGRIIFGSSVGVVKSMVSTLQSSWFRQRERSFAMAIGFSANRLGVIIAITTSNLLYEKLSTIDSSISLYRTGLSLLPSVIITLLALVSSIVAIAMNNRGKSFSITTEQLDKPLKLSDLSQLSFRCWTTILSCAVYYSVVFCFMANSQLYIVSKFGWSINSANLLNSMVFAGTIITNPLVGAFVSKMGLHLTWGMVATMLGITAHVMYTVADQYIIPLLYLSPILYSISYSLFATSMWPYISIIVPRTHTTTAYGIAASAINIGQIIVSLTSGLVADYMGYLFYELYNIVLLALVTLMITWCVVTSKTSSRSTDAAGILHTGGVAINNYRTITS